MTTFDDGPIETKVTHGSILTEQILVRPTAQEGRITFPRSGGTQFRVATHSGVARTIAEICDWVAQPSLAAMALIWVLMVLTRTPRAVAMLASDWPAASEVATSASEPVSLKQRRREGSTRADSTCPSLARTTMLSPPRVRQAPYAQQKQRRGAAAHDDDLVIGTVPGAGFVDCALDCECMH